MGVLVRCAAALLLVLGACYEPDLEDCTVTCRRSDECAGGQVCGDDGFCAQASVAGRCEEPTVPVPATLRIVIEHKGRVVVDDPLFICFSDGDETCELALPDSGWIELRAEVVDKPFIGWTSPACLGQTATCQLLVVPPMTEVRAKFE